MTPNTIRTLTRLVFGLSSIGTLVVAVACAGGTVLPTSPTSVAVRTDATLAAGQAATTMGRPSEMLLTKTCSGDSHCTVQTAASGPLPAATDIFYTGPLQEDRTTSSVIITIPGGDTATGHCSLSYRSFVGTCVLTGGTGALAGVHANVKVTSDFSNPAYPGGLFTWEGTYHFAPAESD